MKRRHLNWDDVSIQDMGFLGQKPIEDGVESFKIWVWTKLTGKILTGKKELRNYICNTYVNIKTE